MPEPDVQPAPAKSEEVHVQAPTGEYGTVSAENLQAALAHHYRIESPDEYAARKEQEQEGALGAVKAFGENAASTATLGLSDVALGGALGNEYRQSRAVRELAYPMASTAGEVAGMLAPAVLTGGESLLGEAAEGGSLLGTAAKGAAAAGEWSPAGMALRGGELASEYAGKGLEALGLRGESALGRAALTGGKMAAGGAFEGAAFGAGGALSEAALAPDGDYDKLAQKLWGGAIEGAKFGALVGGGLGIGGELAGAAARKIGGTFSARQVLEDLSDAKTLKSAGYLGSDIQKLSPERRAILADTVREQEQIGWMDTLGDRAGKLKEAKEATGDLLGSMRKQLDEAAEVGQLPNVGKVLENADTRVTQMMADAKTAAQERAASDISKEIDTIRKNVGDKPMTFEETHELRRQIDNELTNYGKRTYPTAGSTRPPDLYEQGMISLRTDLEREFENAADGVMSKTTPEFKTAYQDAKDRYGALKELSRVSEKRSGMLGGNRDISLTDTIAGVGGMAALGPKGLLLAAANRALRSTQADHIVGKLASQLARIDESVGDSIGRFVNRSRRAVEGVEAAAEQAPRGGFVKRAAKASKEVGKTGVSSGLHVNEGRIEQKERMQEAARKLGAIQREAASPPGTLVSIPGAPKTEAAAEKVRRGAIQWLLDQAPKQMQPSIGHPMLARLARQSTPDPTDVAKWMRKVETVEDPRSVLKALENGSLTTDHVKALEATNPAMLETFRRIAIEKVTSKNADMLYEDRIKMGVLLGVPTDPSLRPESIRASQMVYQIRTQALQQQKQGTAQSTPGRQSENINSRVDELEAAGEIK